MPSYPDQRTVHDLHQNHACADHALIRGVGHSLVPMSKVHVYPVFTVATDPMKSESAGWLNADLSAPK